MLNARLLSDSGESALTALGALGAVSGAMAENPQIIVTAVAIVESHVGRVLEALITSNPIASDSLGRELINAMRTEMFGTWKSRLSWLSTGFDIEVSGDKPAQDFLLVVEVRNAIMHGDASLTDQQVGNSNRLPRFVDIKRRLAKVLGVQVHGRRLIQEVDTSDAALTICRDFVFHLDDAVLHRFPALSISSGPTLAWQ